jgi:hypothetical protein
VLIVATRPEGTLCRIDRQLLDGASAAAGVTSASLQATDDAIEPRTAHEGADETTPSPELEVPPGKRCHVFISHTGEQTRGFVDFLLKDFSDRHPAVKVVLDDHPELQPAAVQKEMLLAMEDARVGERACSCLC